MQWLQTGVLWYQNVCMCAFTHVNVREHPHNYMPNIIGVMPERDPTHTLTAHASHWRKEEGIRGLHPFSLFSLFNFLPWSCWKYDLGMAFCVCMYEYECVCVCVCVCTHADCVTWLRLHSPLKWGNTLPLQHIIKHAKYYGEASTTKYTQKKKSNTLTKPCSFQLLNFNQILIPQRHLCMFVWSSWVQTHTDGGASDWEALIFTKSWCWGLLDHQGSTTWSKSLSSHHFPSSLGQRINTHKKYLGDLLLGSYFKTPY